MVASTSLIFAEHAVFWTRSTPLASFAPLYLSDKDYFFSPVYLWDGYWLFYLIFREPGFKNY